MHDRFGRVVTDRRVLRRGCGMSGLIVGVGGLVMFYTCALCIRVPSIAHEKPACGTIELWFMRPAERGTPGTLGACADTKHGRDFETPVFVSFVPCMACPMISIAQEVGMGPRPGLLRM